MESQNTSVWEKMALCFSKTDDKDAYAPGAENFSVVWPVLLAQINKQYFKETPFSVLDFGCGTGIFAEEVAGYCPNVYACDSSENMISAALKKTSGNVTYGIGSLDFLKGLPQLSLVISIMVFQFIDDIEETIGALCKSVEDNGRIFFAVHNFDYVNECLSHNCKFRNIHKNGQQLKGEIFIDGHWISTYVRDEGKYEDIFNRFGFEKETSVKKYVAPPFELDSATPWSSEKYYMACYRKKGL